MRNISSSFMDQNIFLILQKYELFKVFGGRQVEKPGSLLLKRLNLETNGGARFFFLKIFF